MASAVVVCYYVSPSRITITLRTAMVVSADGAAAPAVAVAVAVVRSIISYCYNSSLSVSRRCSDVINLSQKAVQENKVVL